MQHFSCVMHPAVLADKPGDCPQCGMALTLIQHNHEASNHDQSSLVWRFWLTLPLTLIVLILTMGPMVGMTWVESFMLPKDLPWMAFALTTPVVLWGGSPLFQKGWIALAHKNPNMFTLIAMGIGVSYIFSVVMLIINPSSTHHEGVGLYFESSAVITTLVLLGQVLEYRTRHFTQTAISALQGFVA